MNPIINLRASISLFTRHQMNATFPQDNELMRVFGWATFLHFTLTQQPYAVEMGASEPFYSFFSVSIISKAKE